MLSQGETSTAVLLVVTLLASGVAGATLGGTPTESTPAESAPTDSVSAEATPSASVHDGNEQHLERQQRERQRSEQREPQQGEQQGVVAECAATPPDDGDDPESDVKGWENGVWYDESIDVNQDDGVQAGERERIVARTMARVEAVRCIEFNQSVPVSVVSREQFARQQATGDVSEGLRKFDNVKFEALLLVNESADSIAVQNRNRGSGVLGFYSPRADEIVVIAEDPENLRIDELTLAHELVHAWQDQRFDLTGSPFDAQLRDQVNARNGLVEGDASYTETLYERQCGAEWDCLDAPQRGGGGQLANIGVYLMKYQPYSDGPALVRMVRKVGGWDAVNEMYGNLPASTEQVIHPLRYESDPPTTVTLSDTASESWERVRPPNRPGYGQLGEAALMAMFVYPYYDSQGQTQIIPPEDWFDYNHSGGVSTFDPLNYESNYSTGWDGDRLHVYENDAGEFGYVWKLAWDSPQNAQQFVEGYRRVLRYWGGEQVAPNVWRIADGGFADAFYVDIEGRNVTIVNAPTLGQLSEVRSGIGPIAAANATSGEATGGEAAGGEATGGEATTETDGAATATETSENETTAAA